MTKWDALFAAFLVFINVLAFSLMGADKRRAEKRQWRIKESTLFLFAFLFGGVGATAGMYIFRHKTKHWYFAVFFPLLAVLAIAAAVWIFTVI